MFQPKEPIIQDKSTAIGQSRLSGKQVTQESSTSGFKSSKLSSPSHSAASSSIAQLNASKSSAKGRPTVSSKPTGTKTNMPTKTSVLRTPSKPSVKPKPTATSTATASKRNSKPVSRSSSGRSQDGKSFSRSLDGKSLSRSLDCKSLSHSLDGKSLSRSLKPPTSTTKPKTERKVDIKQSPQNKVMNGKTTTSKAGPSQASGLRKSSIDSRSPSPKTTNSKIESPKTNRKFATNAKTSIPLKSASKLSGKPPVPLPAKPRPPPKAASNSKSTASKSAVSEKQNDTPKVRTSSNAEASRRKLSSPVPKPTVINDLPVCKASMNNQTEQETICKSGTVSPCNQIPVNTAMNPTVKEASNEIDIVSIDKAEVPEDTSYGTADDVDDEIYDDVLHLIDHSRNPVTDSSSGKECNDVQKDEVHSVPVSVTSSMALPFGSSTTNSEDVPLLDKTVDHTESGTLAQSTIAVVQEVPSRDETLSRDETMGEIEADSSDKVNDDTDNVQSSNVESSDLKSEVEPVVYTTDDVLVQKTTGTIATTSLMGPATLNSDDIYMHDDEMHSITTTTGSIKHTEVNPVTVIADDIYDDVVHNSTNMNLITSSEPEVHTADDIYDDVLFPQVGHKVTSEASRCLRFSDTDFTPCDQKQENVEKVSKFPSPQLQQIKEARQSPRPQYVEETTTEMNYGNILETGDTAVKQSEFQSSSDDDIEVVELTQSPRQSRVARFQRAADKDFGYRDSGLGIEAYYDKIGVPSDVAIEPIFYDEIDNREQLETISSTEDVQQTEPNTEDVINLTDLAPPALPPRSNTMIEEKLKHDLPRHLVEESPKLIEATTVESGFEDQWLDGQNSEAKSPSNPSAIEQGSLQDNGNSPPPLPPRRPRSSLVSLEDRPKSPPVDKDKSRSGSPQVPPLPPRAISSPQLHSPKELASSSSSLAPSQSAVSVLSGRSENIADGCSDASRPNSFVESGSETPSEHKKEKSKFSLGIFSRKKSDRRKKSCDKSAEKSTENTEEAEHIRPRASSLGHSLTRKKSSRQAMKKKGSVPPELEYSLPDPIHIVGDEEYDDCTVIQNNWKSLPSQECANTDATIALVPLSDLGPEVKAVYEDGSSGLEKQMEIKKSFESFGSFTQNFEDSSGWFDDIYDMVANSSTTSVTDGTPTIAVNNEDELYDVVAPDLVPSATKNSGLTVAVTDSPNLSKRTSSSYDSSGSFDSYDEENGGDELAPLNSELSAVTKKGRTLPQRQPQTKSQSQHRPRSCSYNDTNDVIPIVQTKRNIEEIKEVS